MEKEYLSNNEISPPHHFQPLLPQLHTHNGFGNSNSENSTEQYSRFESALSSMVSSPVATNSATDVIAIREMIGKLGTICNGSEISPEFLSGNTYISGVNNTSNTSSSYNTPMDSPSNLQVPIMNHFVKENFSNSRNSTYTGSVLPALPTDPGFAERAAKFSCFGSKSFNGRTSHIGVNNAEFQYRSSGLSLGNSKLHRVASSPSLKLLASQLGIQENQNSGQPHMDMRPNSVNVSDFDRNISNISASGFDSNQETSVSAQNPAVENWLGAPMDSISRKRKGFPRVNAKEAVSAQCGNAAKDAGDDDIEKSYLNRLDMSCSKVNKNDDVKLEDMKGDAECENDNNQKPPEPLKDYIHVRARRGQATDSHSLAERVRREKISKKMQLLQDLVPGCNKVTGKALMLDEIINYVQSLQRQVEFLSMKLATVNPRLDNNMENLLSKNITETSGTIPYQIYPIYSSASMYNGHQGDQISQVHKTSEPTDAALCRNVGMQLDGFGEGLSQFSSFSEDDLQSIVQMGLATSQTPHMKLEL